jgi:hypothetical protein
MHKIGAVSVAAGVPIPTLCRWSDRKTLKPSRDDKASTGSGDHRLFSRATVIRIAIANQLIKLGVAASPANRSASLFIELFEFGRTLLLTTPTGAKIVNAEYSAPLTDICGKPFESAVIIDIGQIVSAIDQARIQQKDEDDS